MAHTERIAIFIPSLRGGGAERAMVALANGFARRGLAVDLVLATAEGVFAKEVSGSVRIIDLASGRMADSLFRLAGYLKRESPDVLLSAMTHVNLTAVWAKRLARVQTRLVLSERSTLTHALKGLEARPLAAWLIPRLVRFSYPAADAVVSVSLGVQDDLRRYVCLSREQAHVIYNPVVDDGLVHRALEALDHPWFAPGAPPVILGAGRLTEAKNFPLLIRAFNRLRAERECRLMILGEGPLRSSLESMVAASDHAADISMPGFVENPLPFMTRSRVFALSSSWEGLPGVLIQAMACGTPVVSTDCPSGPQEILEGGRWGRLVPVDDEVALSDALGECLDDVRPPAVADRALFFSEANSVGAYLNLLLPDDGRKVANDA
jgi:glycosyltransferase involved in cell wall biosynthesis